MQVIVVYRPKSEHARKTEEYLRDFKYSQPLRQVTVIDADSRDGLAKAELYDIAQYPAVLALSNDGQLLKSWTGELPLMDELAYYTIQE